MKRRLYVDKNGNEEYLSVSAFVNLNFFTQSEKLHDLVSKILSSYKAWDVEGVEIKGKQIKKIRSLDFYKSCKLVCENLIASSNAGFSIPLGWHYYSKIPDRYNPANISGRKISAVLYFMQDQGLIRMLKGCNFGNKTGYFTRVLPEKAFVRDLKATKLTKLSLTLDRLAERMVLKDTKENKKRMIDYKETNKIYSCRKFIREYEEFLKGFEFHCDGEKLGYIHFRRIFNNQSFKMGGRFYSSYQNIKSHIRSKKMTCNSEKLVEYDYSGIHINMLYAMEGLGLYDGDVYTVEGYEDLRDIFKIALQIAINAKDRRAAYSGMNDHLRKNGINTKEISGKMILAAFSEKHAPIKKYFFSCIGMKLQYKDSCIVERILKRGTKAGIPILPVHDSFLFPESKSEKVVEWMREASRKELGIILNIDKK